MVQINGTAEVVIIGGGVIGLSIARSLALRGVRDVLLVERGSLGAESSWAAAGMLAPQAEANRAHEFFALTCRSRDLYPEFAASLLTETGIDIELDNAGTLYCAFTDEDAVELDRRYKWQSAAGLPIARLTTAEVIEHEPHVSSHVRGALEFPLDTQVENRRLISALIASNERLGVRLQTETEVTRLTLEKDRVTGVQTSRGQISAANVVIAAGAWSSQIQSDKILPDVRVKPVRGQMLCFQPEAPLSRHIIYSPRGYLVPRRDGRMLAGSTSEQAGFDKQVTEAGRQSILSSAAEICGRLLSLPIKDSWAGLRPRAGDTLPVLGPCAEIGGLYYATGHYRNGILLAPITGELIATAIVEQAFPSEWEIFSPDRFRLVSATA
jgi:glycine oxidase